VKALASRLIAVNSAAALEKFRVANRVAQEA
jgi:hypothetical protein